MNRKIRGTGWDGLVRAAMNERNALVWFVAACAFTVRLGLVIWAGNAPESPITGGGDTFAYQALADSIANHRGLSYAGMPTALRPPLYPLFLVLGQFIADGHYRIFIRLAQLVLAVLTAVVCAQISRKLGGSTAIAFAAALAAPTLIFFTAEILSETLAALIVAAFFYLVVTRSSPVWVGAAIGLGMLERFNLAALALAYVGYEFATKKPAHAARNVALGGFLALAVVGPWFVRNLVVFQGKVLYSTHTGTNLLQGLITPDGRTQAGDNPKIQSAAGWSISQIETNSLGRAAFPPEPELDHIAMSAALAQLRHVSLLTLAGRKLGFFWLSTDQLFATESFSLARRVERMAGVFGYWFLLALGIAGWKKLRFQHSDAALLVTVYALIVTAMHLPFVMNTRIRTPLIEPVLAILAGVAFTEIAGPTNHSDVLIKLVPR